MVLKSLRDKLSPKEVGLFKLAVWTCLVTWLVFFLINSLIVAHIARESAVIWYPGVWGHVIMKWALPVWIVFTCLLIIVGIARYSKRKLS